MKEVAEQVRAIRKVRNQQGEEIFQMVMVEPETGRIIPDPRPWYDAVSAGQTYVTLEELEAISKELQEPKKLSNGAEELLGIDETPRLREEQKLRKEAAYKEPSLQEGMEEEVVLELVQEGGYYE
ncbi:MULTISPECIES: hypothetical protein [Anaerostipes]|uniref:hypothetical protein n=1 Tax=Anaerostipes TaxID=207244 RepID=UPI000E493EF0|nr:MULTISPECIES: hypothetical protein [Anaerostipes]RGH23186.1 hypothetical protein DWV34_08635 [Anaerostipes sp. AF04-45]